jgi:hypothetical protein
MAIVTKVMTEVVERFRDDATELSGFAATRLSRKFSDDTRAVAVRPLASLAAAAQADTVTVRWRHGLVGSFDQTDGRIRLRLPDRTISFPESCAAAMAALHHGLVTDAAGLPGLDRPDGAVLISRLLREAVVVPAAG